MGLGDGRSSAGPWHTRGIPECDHRFRSIVIQYVINGFGLLYVAGFTATNKLYGLLELAAVSFGYATSSFVGQNLGAGEYGRIKEGVRASAKISIGIAVAIGAVLLLFGRSILKYLSPRRYPMHQKC